LEVNHALIVDWAGDVFMALCIHVGVIIMCSLWLLYMTST